MVFALCHYPNAICVRLCDRMKQKHAHATRCLTHARTRPFIIICNSAPRRNIVHNESRTFLSDCCILSVVVLYATAKMRARTHAHTHAPMHTRHCSTATQTHKQIKLKRKPMLRALVCARWHSALFRICCAYAVRASKGEHIAFARFASHTIRTRTKRTRARGDRLQVIRDRVPALAAAPNEGLHK